ncbi:MAG: ABC transporter ATP-binding protein [Armatimonadota bacterium]
MLEVVNVSARYGQVMVLREVSLQVPEGRSVCLLGPNGAGKTTTLRTVVGLLRPSSGEVRFEGRRIDRLPADRIVRLGLSLVPERREVFPYLSVAENLRMGAYTRRDHRAVVNDLERILELFPVLRGRMDQPAGTLSGGEQQMLAIGRALMAGPRFLLLDEPSLGLAPMLVQLMFRAIAQIRAGGASLLLVEQNARMALSVTDYAYVLESGRIALEGSSADLKGNTAVQETYLGQI